jgi:TonB family protein
MIQEVAEPQRWSARRWYGLIALVLAAQFGLIFWLGRPQRVLSPPPADFAPLLQLSGTGSVQVLALSDPTLFALPHRESFSGAAWLTFPPKEFPPFAELEPAHFLSLIGAGLGADFESFMTTNAPERLPAIAQPEFALKLPSVQETACLPERSQLRVTGALAGRRLFLAPDLPSWPSAEILTNSVVQVLIDSGGKSVSALLLSKSGSTEADQHAVRTARRTRFEPLNPKDAIDPQEGLAWGQLVFEWHTLPLQASNSPAEAPQAKQ